jgi:hypothetical protein
MSFKDKIMNIVIAHPHLVMFGIGLAVSITIGIVIASLEQGHLAYAGSKAKGSRRSDN